MSLPVSVPPAAARLTVVYVPGPRQEAVLKHLKPVACNFDFLLLDDPSQVGDVVGGKDHVLLVEPETAIHAAHADTNSRIVLIAGPDDENLLSDDAVICVDPSELRSLVPSILEAAEIPASHDKRRVYELQQLIELRKTFIKAPSFDEALHQTFQHLGEILPIQCAEVWIPVPGSSSLKLAGSWGNGSSHHHQTTLSMADAIPHVVSIRGNTLPAAAWRAQSPLIVSDLTDCDFFARCEKACELGLQSAIAMSVLDGNTPHAVMLFFVERRELSPGLVRFVRTSLSQLGDLLSLRLSEQEVEQSQELLKQTFVSIEEAVCIVAVDERRIISCNRAAANMFGYSVQEMMGLITDKLHPTKAAWKDFGAISGPIVEQGLTYQGIHKMRRRDGSVFPTQHTITPLHDASRKLKAVVSVIRDQSEAVRHEEEIAELRSEIAHASRIAVLGQVVGGVIHGLSNPLTALESRMAYAQQVCQQAEDVLGLRSTIGESRAELGRLREFVQQLRDILKRRKPHRLPVPSNLVVTQALSLIRPNAERLDITIQTLLVESAPEIMVDRIQIEQVLLTLVQNSIEALQEIEVERRIVVSTRATESEVTFAVHDNGCGVKLPEDKVFEPFISTKADGLGLGLATCKYIVEAHGGTISIESKVGQGTEATFSIPL